MKIIMVNKKRLGVTIIIIGLMVLMFSIQKSFQGNMEITSLMQSNIKGLKQYSALNGKIKYKLPEEWITKEEKFSGGEIIYHNNFEAKDLKIHGFVEVWNLESDLYDFLKRSKYISEKQNKISEYTINKFKIKNREGFNVEYVITNKDKMQIKCSEYFIKNNNNLVRISFFVIKDKFKENMPTVFRSIVYTLDFG